MIPDESITGDKDQVGLHLKFATQEFSYQMSSENVIGRIRQMIDRVTRAKRVKLVPNTLEIQLPDAFAGQFATQFECEAHHPIKFQWTLASREDESLSDELRCDFNILPGTMNKAFDVTIVMPGVEAELKFSVTPPISPRKAREADNTASITRKVLGFDTTGASFRMEGDQVYIDLTQVKKEGEDDTLFVLRNELPRIGLK